MNVSARILNGIVDAGVNVSMIIESSSEQSLCLPIPIKDVEKSNQDTENIWKEEISRLDIEDIEICESVDIITVIAPD